MPEADISVNTVEISKLVQQSITLKDYDAALRVDPVERATGLLVTLVDGLENWTKARTTLEASRRVHG
jgi:hypothetical protein